MRNEAAKIKVEMLDNYLSHTCQDYGEDDHEAMMMAIQALKQEPKTGHWIYDKTTENWRCSKCNETPKTMGYVGTADFMTEHFKFCNHCGARMLEPQKSEDKE